MAEIRIENLHRRFGDFVAVRDSNLTVRNGDFFVLLGPSGCGKTTTLRMIAGLEIPTSGRILLDGEDVTFLRASKRDIAFVFQLFALYPHMNVGQNLAFPLKSEGVARAEIKKQVAAGLLLQPADDAQVGGLAAARGPEQNHELTVRHREADAVNGGNFIEFLDDVPGRYRSH